MNWSVYSKFVGNVFGAPLAIEGLAAFFLESTFLGLWIFGWNRLSPRLHLATLWIAVLGKLAVGLLHPRRQLVDAAPGRLQDRQRRGAADERLGAALEHVRAPRVSPHDPRRSDLRAIVMLGVCCWHFLRGHKVELFRQGGEAGADRRGAGDLLQLVVGNRFGEAVTSAQSMKIAASEAQWNTCQPAGSRCSRSAGSPSRTRRRASRSRSQTPLVHGTGSFNGKVRASTSSRPRSSASTAPATTCRTSG